MLSLQLFAPAIALPRAAVHSRSPPVHMVASLEPPPTAMRKPLTEPVFPEVCEFAGVTLSRYNIEMVRANPDQSDLAELVSVMTAALQSSQYVTSLLAAHNGRPAT